MGMTNAINISSKGRRAARARVRNLRKYYEGARDYAARNPGTPGWILRAAARRYRLGLWVLGFFRDARSVPLHALVILIALLAGACDAGRVTVSVEDWTLSGPTQAAINSWNEALAKQCPDVRLVMIDGDADIRVRWGTPATKTYHGHNVLGVHLDGVITLDANDDGWENGYLPESVLQHELGHALGASHSGDETDVMNVHTPRGEPKPISPRDVGQVCNQFDGVP